MFIISIIITLIVVGFLLWLAKTYIPMDPLVANILNVVVLVALVFWLLQVFGLLTSLN